MKPSCDIVVLTWNQKDIIKSFVESFLGNTKTSCRLIIVANGCHDGTPEYLATLRSTSLCEFKIIVNKENNGFVGAMNQGLEISDAPYVGLANNDLLFTLGWLEEVISVFESDNRIGLLNPNSNNLGVRPLKGESLQSLAQGLKEKNSARFKEMPFCVGFCMFTKREVIAKVGGLSKEFYPLFFEDTDYSMKVAKAGYLIGVASRAYVWHQEHASFKQMGGEREALFKQSRAAFIKKWGKILRIAWIESAPLGVRDNLRKGIDLARQGNYVAFYIKNAGIQRGDIFKDRNSYEHSGVQIKRFGSYIGLAWKILLKKKKPDLIICKNKTLRHIFEAFGQKASACFDSGLIEGIKRAS